MPSHLALLRGINVGGHNKVAMADLRRLVVGLGHREVASYIQSGNVVFSSESEVAEIAAELEDAIAEQLGVRCGVVVLTREQLAAAVEANPFPEEADPKHLHAIFHMRELEPASLEAIEEAAGRAREKHSADEVRVIERTLYLRTPTGLGHSVLAAELARVAPRASGTARNWATVTKLLQMLDS